jgi:hypothetical protein
MEGRRQPVLLSIMGTAVLVAGVLIALGLATEGPRPPAPGPADAARQGTLPPVVVQLPTPEPRTVPPLVVAGEFSQARRPSGEGAERRRRGRHRGARPLSLPPDLTLNPF